MLQCDFRLSGEIVNDAAPIPAACEIRIEGKSAGSQIESRIDIFVQICQHMRHDRQHAWVVAGDLECPSGEFDTGAAVRLAALAPPSSDIELLVVPGGQSQCGSKLRIALDSLFEQLEALLDSIPFERQM